MLSLSQFVAYAYDNDGLLTAAGGLALTRDLGNGLLLGTTIGSVYESIDPNGFGEPAAIVAYDNATATGDPLLSFDYARDDLGRIQQKGLSKRSA